jgi:hypothetical protein
MQQFEKGDRVVYEGDSHALADTGEKGIVERVDCRDFTNLRICTDKGRVFWVKASLLTLDNSAPVN